MLRIIAVAFCAVILAACGATRPGQSSEQFCDLKTETVSVKDRTGRVTDESTVEVMKCNDNKVDRLFHAQVGMSNDCGEYKYLITLNNRLVERVGYACKKYNGTWEVVPHPSIYRR